MNLRAIKEIVNNDDIEDKEKEELIITVLSKDNEVIPDILKILSSERLTNKSIITDLNVNMSRTLFFIKNKKLLRKDKDFLKKEIVETYQKWKNHIKSVLLFKDEGLE